MPRNILLIGSLPFENAAQAFDEIDARFAGRVKRLPDGETGPRRNWLQWQSENFSHISVIEPAGISMNGAPLYRMRPGMPSQAVSFAPLGYAEAAMDSYTEFAKRAGAERFQIGLATPLSIVAHHVDDAFQQLIEPAYEQRLLAEIDAITAAIPPDKLAIQWNLAAELSVFEGYRKVHFEKVFDGVLARLVRLAEHVPDQAELGLHFCFDDFSDCGFPQPETLDRFVDLANGLSGMIGRRIDYLHFPCPEGPTGPDYFRPLERLTLRPETELYLGVVKSADGLAGAQSRIRAAAEYIADFGIAAECGLGSIDAGDIGEILDLHLAAAG